MTAEELSAIKQRLLLWLGSEGRRAAQDIERLITEVERRGIEIDTLIQKGMINIDKSENMLHETEQLAEKRFATYEKVIQELQSKIQKHKESKCCGGDCARETNYL